MNLAAILGFCVLTSPGVAAGVFPTHLPQLNQETPAAAGHAAEPSPSGAGSQSEPTSPDKTTPAHEPQGTEPPPATTKPEPETSESKTFGSKTSESKKAESATQTPRKKRRRKTVTASSDAAPEKKVVRDGGTADPVVQLAPGMSAEQASSQRQNTTQLLAATDTNLKEISSRQLNPSQQDSVSQIRKYIEQAKAAEQAGDVQRAHNLASKALLLSDDLAKH
jgi:hypothetical protein